jgi:hypothetical protein
MFRSPYSENGTRRKAVPHSKISLNSKSDDEAIIDPLRTKVLDDGNFQICARIVVSLKFRVGAFSEGELHGS